MTVCQTEPTGVGRGRPICDSGNAAWFSASTFVSFYAFFGAAKVYQRSEGGPSALHFKDRKVGVGKPAF